jgi:hypothetical protein
MTLDLDPDAYRVASREARAAGQDVRDWLATLIFGSSTGDIPFDDCGFYSPLPEEEPAPVG